MGRASVEWPWSKNGKVDLRLLSQIHRTRTGDVSQCNGKTLIGNVDPSQTLTKTPWNWETWKETASWLLPFMPYPARKLLSGQWDIK